MAEEATSDDGHRLGDLYELLTSIRESAELLVASWDNDEPVRSIARYAMFVSSDANRAYDQLTAIALAVND